MRILPVNPRRGPNADIIHRARVFTLGFVAYPSLLPAHSLTRDFSLLPTPSNENEFPREPRNLDHGRRWNEKNERRNALRIPEEYLIERIGSLIRTWHSKPSRLGKTGFANRGRRKMARLNTDRRSSFVARLIISFLFFVNSRGVLKLIIEITSVSEIN